MASKTSSETAKEVDKYDVVILGASGYAQSAPASIFTKKFS
jgi:hypothetical protein